MADFTVYPVIDNFMRSPNALSARTAIGITDHIDISLIQSTSGNWDSTYTTVSANSASWVGGGGGGSDVSALSGNWESTYTTVQTESAGWVGGGGGTSGTTLSGTTSDGTQTEIFIDGGATRMTVAADTTWMFSALVAARSTANNNSAGYKIEGVIKNDGGTTGLVGTTVKTVFGEDVGGWDATIAADDTFDALTFLVTGEANVNWVATVNKTEV